MTIIKEERVGAAVQQNNSKTLQCLTSGSQKFHWNFGINWSVIGWRASGTVEELSATNIKHEGQVSDSPNYIGTWMIRVGSKNNEQCTKYCTGCSLTHGKLSFKKQETLTNTINAILRTLIWGIVRFLSRLSLLVNVKHVYVCLCTLTLFRHTTCWVGY